MRLTIIKDDAAAGIDGEWYFGLDVSSLPDNFHALQWYETYGDLETFNSETRVAYNETIYSLQPYAAVIASWEQKKNEASGV